VDLREQPFMMLKNKGGVNDESGEGRINA